MKIEIMGYSGSGKSTVCRALAARYHLPALHLDTVQFLPHWEVRAEAEKQQIVRTFLDEHPDGWVIDGNYSGLSYARRCEEADVILQLLFGRLDCLFRCARRYRRYKGQSRPDMADDCNEKLDGEFIRWILWEGRSRAIRARYRQIQRQYPDKVVVLRNQRQLDAYLNHRKL